MHGQHPPAATIAAGFALVGAVAAQPTPETDVTEILRQAARARATGDQAAYVACGYRLRTLAPDDPVGHLVLGIGHASFGPRFGCDMALHALARVQRALRAPLDAVVLARLAACAGVPKPDATVLHARLQEWCDALADRAPLLLAPDRGSLAHTCASLERRGERLAALVAGERARSARLRRQQRDAERQMQRERARARQPGAGMIDLQPYADRIGACRRDLASSARRRREFERELGELRRRQGVLARRLAELRAERAG